MKKYALFLLLVVSCNSIALSNNYIVNCTNYLTSKLAIPIITLIKSICNTDVIGDKAIFILDIKQIPPDITSKITDDNFYIIGKASELVAMAHDKFNELIIEVPSPFKYKKSAIQGSYLVQYTDQSWLENELRMKAPTLVETSIASVNNIFKGITDKGECDETYKYALIGFAAGVSGFLVLFIVSVIWIKFIDKNKKNKHYNTASRVYRQRGLLAK